MTSREVIKILKADGWFLVATRGSHNQFRHPTKPGKVTVIHPTNHFHPKTLRSMEKQAGLTFK